MLISLIVATMGPAEHLDRLLRSLEDQAGEFEVIIVEQNSPPVLCDVAERYPRLALKHMLAEPGLSNARNVGLAQAKGEILCFPDDDCWYSPSLLEKVERCFRGDPNLGLLISGWEDGTGRAAKRRLTKAMPLSKYTMWEVATSICMFVRRSALAKAGCFDTSLGLGASTSWAAGEDMDLCLRIVDSGVGCRLEPEIVTYHQLAGETFASRKLLLYTSCLGFVLAKNSLPLLYLSCVLARPLLGTMLAVGGLRFSLAKFRAITFVGLTRGIFAGTSPLKVAPDQVAPPCDRYFDRRR